MHQPDILYVSMEQFPHLAELTNSSDVRNQATGESNLGNLGVTAHFACCSFLCNISAIGRQTILGESCN